MMVTMIMMPEPRKNVRERRIKRANCPYLHSESTHEGKRGASRVINYPKDLF